jgi:hypothetical protein
VVSPQALADAVRAAGEIAYFRFRPPEIDAARARLALELRLASSKPSRPTALLSSVVVTFVKAGDEWQAIEEPILLAS